MTKRNFRPKVLFDPVATNIVFHGNNNQQNMKRQRPTPAAPGLFSAGSGRPVRLQPRAENDGFGEEETSESMQRKFSKITRREGDDSVQIIFDATNFGKVPEENVARIKNPGKIFSKFPCKFSPLNLRSLSNKRHVNILTFSK